MMPLDCDSTISTNISTAAWKRPGTPELARDAAAIRMPRVTTPIAIDQNRVSQLITLMSMMKPCFTLCRCCR